MSDETSRVLRRVMKTTADVIRQHSPSSLIEEMDGLLADADADGRCNHCGRKDCTKHLSTTQEEQA